MKQIDLENYIRVLLKSPSIDKKILSDEIQNIELLLSVYIAGLKKEDFPIDYLFKEFDLKDIPAQFHILVGQMAILKAKINEAPKDHLKLTVVSLLEEYKNYFLPR